MDYLRTPLFPPGEGNKAILLMVTKLTEVKRSCLQKTLEMR
jgi:hypothetical protein